MGNYLDCDYADSFIGRGWKLYSRKTRKTAELGHLWTDIDRRTHTYSATLLSPSGNVMYTIVENAKGVIVDSYIDVKMNELI